MTSAAEHHNMEVKHITVCEQISDLVTYRRLQYFGHIIQASSREEWIITGLLQKHLGDQHLNHGNHVTVRQ